MEGDAMTEGGTPAGRAPRAGAAFAVLAGSAFVTGGAALLEEILWGRMLGRLLGSTSLSVATVLAGFLGGIAIGAFLAGRFLGEARAPLRLYGVIEVLAGGAALLFTAILDGAAPLAAQPYGPLALLLLLAAFATPLGMSFPLAVLFIERAMRGSGGSRPRAVSIHVAIAIVYGLNALGGSAGALAAGFGVIPALGEEGAIRLAAALQAAAGLAVAAAALRWEPAARAAADIASPSEVPAPAAAMAPAGKAIALHLLLFASGLVSLYWEVLWTRILVLVVGSSVTALAMVTAGVLLGIGAGSLALGGGRLRGSGFWALPLAVAWLLAAAFFAVPFLPDAYLLGVRRAGLDPFLWGALGAGAVTLAPAFLIGALFPWGVAALPRRTGTLLAVNAIGAALGAFLGGPLSAPFLGLEGAYELGALLAGLLALCGLAAAPRPLRLPAPAVISAALLPAILLWAAGIRAPDRASWNLQRLLSGVYQWSEGDLLETSLDAMLAERELAVLEIGREVMVTVEIDPSNTVSVRGNGKVEGSVPLDRGKPSLANLPTQILLGALPGLLRPGEPAAVIGLGSGVTLGAALRAGLAPIDLLEIEEAFARAVRRPEVVDYFSPYHGGAFDSPLVRFRFGDARRQLIGPLSSERWGVLVSQPSEPWIAGSASLFTREFFDLAAARLGEGGLFVQWVQLYKLDPEWLRLLARTFRRSFNRVFILQPPRSGELLLLGSHGEIDLARFLAPLPRELAPLLAEAGVESGEDILAAVLLGPEGVERWTEQGGARSLNTDSRNLLEFRAARYLHRGAELTLENLDRLLLLGEEDPVTRYLPAARLDRALARRLAARNLACGDFWEARGILSGDDSAEAAALRVEIERAIEAALAERGRSRSRREGAR